MKELPKTVLVYRFYTSWKDSLQQEQELETKSKALNNLLSRHVLKDVEEECCAKVEVKLLGAFYCSAGEEASNLLSNTLVDYCGD